MTYLIYDILLFFAALVYLPFYALRGRVHRNILNRLGFFTEDLFKSLSDKEAGPVVWIHAVSVGEARAAESLLRLIRLKYPGWRIVVSTVTPTGYEIAHRITKEREIVCYAPIDISFVVEKFLNVISPKLLIIMETEIWPNLIRLSKKHGCRVAVVNGRISERSYRGYLRFKGFLRRIVMDVDLFCMQSDEACERINVLGADPQRIKKTGNIKFDISEEWKESPSVAFLKKALGDSLLWIAGSTHDNEEELVLDIYRSLHKDFGDLRLLIAPRHVNRLDKIRRTARLAGFETICFSAVRKLGPSQVIVLDTVGDLNALYRLCTIAFVGGSLVKKGGHNPIEPALFGKPIIFGKYMDNFREIRDIFIKEKAALEVEDQQGLEYECRRLLASPEEREALGERARGLLDKNKGAAARTFAEIIKVAV